MAMQVRHDHNPLQVNTGLFNMQTPSPSHAYLKQRHWLFGTREFVIKDSRFLLVRERSLLRSHETLIPLELLQANPTYSTSFSIKWLLNSLFMAALTLTLLLLSQKYASILLLLLAFPFGGAALVLLYRFFLYTTRLTVFRQRHTNENFLFLWQNKPDTTQFRTFITRLNHLIRQADTTPAPASPTPSGT
ncbi:MAG: hypothetical protein KDI44_08015 [Thiothrix sp.]|nr:hypothetical protein [Thiothrix sp.]HPQ95843.1 hypothetical protein [Thiolinea sp.]